jgi:GntR family transcriptional regulator / MocR family aminotransferase
MPKRAAEISLLKIQLEPNQPTPMYRQLYEGMRRAILEGEFAPGARMPATRTLAQEMSVSRNTVMQAFEQLFAEGYLEGRVGSGTYVSRALPDDLLRASPINPIQQKPVHKLVAPTRALSQRGQQTAALRMYVSDDNSYTVRPFVTGLPALDAFPMDTWIRVTNRCWRYLSSRELGYAAPAGYLPLRKAIAARLRETRAVRCEAEQVIIVGGTQQAINLCAQIFLNPGDAVWIEDPCYMGAKAALRNNGARLVPVQVDAEGLRVSDGVAREPNAKMAFVSPSYQVPMCVTMSLPRRLALLDHAARTGMWVIEDDYDSEFRYAGRPLASLQSLDTAQRVIYIGTFSKSLLPALRLGFIVVPPDLVDAFTAARAIADRHAHTLEQAVVAEFIAEGHFAQHLRRMRTLYAERQAALVSAAEKELAGLLEVQPADAGLNLVGWLPDGASDVAMSAAAERAGLSAPSLTSFAIDPVNKPLARGGLLLGYAPFAPREIRRGVRELGGVMRTLNPENCR